MTPQRLAAGAAGRAPVGVLAALVLVSLARQSASVASTCYDVTWGQEECERSGCLWAGGACKSCSGGTHGLFGAAGDFLFYGGRKYIIATGLATFSAAQENCKDTYGGYLATADTPEESLFLRNYIRKDIWLGHYDSDTGAALVLCNMDETCGSTCPTCDPTTYTNWRPGNAGGSNQGPDDCIIGISGSMLWTWTKCSNTHTYVCEVKAEPQTLALGFDGLEILRFDSPASGTCADDFCSLVGGHLLSLESAEKTRKLEAALPNAGNLHIGLTAVEGLKPDAYRVWAWSSGDGFPPDVNAAAVGDVWQNWQSSSTLASPRAMKDAAGWTWSVADDAELDFACQRGVAAPSAVRGKCSELLSAAGSDILLRLSFEPSAQRAHALAADGVLAGKPVYYGQDGITDAAGKFGSAAGFKGGVRDVIQLPSVNRYFPGMYPTSDFSVCLWLFLGAGSRGTILSVANYFGDTATTEGVGYSLTVSSVGDLVFRAAGIDSLVEIMLRPIFALGLWGHVCYVHTATEMRVFINGEEPAQGTVRSVIDTYPEHVYLTAAPPTRGQVFMGCSSTGDEPLHDAKVDELVIIKRAITLQEAADIRDKCVPVSTFPPATFPPGTTAPLATFEPSPTAEPAAETALPAQADRHVSVRVVEPAVTSESVAAGTAVISIELLPVGGASTSWRAPTNITVSATDPAADVYLATDRTKSATGLAAFGDASFFEAEVQGSVLLLRFVGDETYASKEEETVVVSVRESATWADRDGVRLRVEGTGDATFVIESYEGPVSETEKTVVDGVTTATALASVNGAAAANAARTAALLHLMECPVDMRTGELSRAENPLQLTLSLFDAPARGGALVGNTIVIYSFFALHALIVVTVYYCKRRSDKTVTMLKCAAICRFPSYTFFPAIFFYQATLESGVNIFLHEPSAGGIMIALFCVSVYNIALWIGVTYVLHPVNFSANFMHFSPARTHCERASRFALGAGDYQSAKDRSYVWRFGLLFQDFWPHSSRYIHVEILFNTMLGILDGIEMRSKLMCKVHVSLVLGGYLVYLTYACYKRPNHAPLNNLVHIGTALAQTLAVICVLAHMFQSDQNSSAAQLALYFLYSSMFLLFIKSLLDLLSACHENIVNITRRDSKSADEIEIEDVEKLDLNDLALQDSNYYLGEADSPFSRASTVMEHRFRTYDPDDELMLPAQSPLASAHASPLASPRSTPDGLKLLSSHLGNSLIPSSTLLLRSPSSPPSRKGSGRLSILNGSQSPIIRVRDLSRHDSYNRDRGFVNL
ncbi:hypothetical protein DIPPA_25784 [Diplonema papillatum]|nr:hypothetical protein DIPPA_25784 [Diplonema papillatum]|eukprot:gene8509-13135_t